MKDRYQIIRPIWRLMHNPNLDKPGISVYFLSDSRYFVSNIFWSASLNKIREEALLLVPFIAVVTAVMKSSSASPWLVNPYPPAVRNLGRKSLARCSGRLTLDFFYLRSLVGLSKTIPTSGMYHAIITGLGQGHPETMYKRPLENALRWRMVEAQ